MANFLYNFFIPEIEYKIFDAEKYLNDLHSGKFRDNVNLGVCSAKEGSWLLKDFTKEPNALFVGSMGSGKSIACRFSILTWMLANSDQTILFIVDTVKGAQDYKMFFGLDQVYEIIGNPEGVGRLIELLYDEAIARKEEFKRVGAKDIREYEAKSGEKMARLITVLEEFHALPYAVMNFDKDHKINGTMAFKFHQLMRVGRSIGLWFMAASQKSTASDVPKEVVPNFTQKQIFRVSKGEANYVLGNTAPSEIRTDQQGKCYTEYGEVQFPFIDETDCNKLLDKYIKKIDAKCARLTHSMIKDTLEGRSTRELYQHKSLIDLAKQFKSLNSEVIITLLHEKMGCTVESLNSALDTNNISHIVTWRNGERSAVMVKPQNKIGQKHINKLVQGISKYSCDNGILYTAALTPTTSLYKYANNHEIELIDHEDLVLLAQQVEYALERGENMEFKPDQLASDDKESGEYQNEHHITKETDVQDEQSEQKDSNSKKIKHPENLIEQNLKKHELEKEKDISQEFVTDFVDQVDIDSIINENAKEIIEEPKVINSIKKEQVKKSEGMPELFNRKNPVGSKLKKRPSLSINMDLTPADSPVVLVHCLRNESNEIYRVLFYTLKNNIVKHKYFIDKKVVNKFNYIQKQQLGLKKDLNEWNNNPLVQDEQEFLNTLGMFIDQFKKTENIVSIVIWEHDVDFLDNYIIKIIEEKDLSLSIDPIFFGKHMIETFGLDDEESKDIRGTLFSYLKIKSNEDDFFEEIDKDFQLWNA